MLSNMHCNDKMIAGNLKKKKKTWAYNLYLLKTTLENVSMQTKKLQVNILLFLSTTEMKVSKWVPTFVFIPSLSL